MNELIAVTNGKRLANQRNDAPLSRAEYEELKRRSPDVSG